MNDFLRRNADWILPDWPAPPNVRALITTRAGGVSQGSYESLNLGNRVGDDPRSVIENRARLRACLPAEPTWLRQVHGNRVVKGEEAVDVPEADALVTRTHAIVLAVQAADCMPVLLCNQAGKVIGAAHAGWRGLCSGVIENTVLAMRETFRAEPMSDNQLIAYLGPAIGPSNFEVGSEVREMFLAHDRSATAHFEQKENGQWLADMYGLARQRLAGLGINRVFGGGFCTYADAARFFSYRRDKITGRMAALIWLE